MIEKAWNWNKVNNKYWEIPDKYAYFLIDRWKNFQNRKVLDLGCGIGRHSKMFAKNGYSVTASDISESGLEKVNQLAKDYKLDINTVLSNMTELEMKDNQFDGIIAFNSIYHTDRKGFIKVINETKRVLKNNGEIFITLLSKEDPSYEVSIDKIIDNNTRMKQEEDGTELPHFFLDYNEIYTFFKDFKIINIEQVTQYFNSSKHVHFNVLMRLEEKYVDKND